MKNQEIASIFYDIAEILEIKKVEWKPVAYRKAARSILSLSDNVEDIYKENGIDGLKEISGVGDAIAKKIAEYINTGKIKEYEELKKSIPFHLTELSAIGGLGPKRAHLLFKKLNRVFWHSTKFSRLKTSRVIRFLSILTVNKLLNTIL